MVSAYEFELVLSYFFVSPMKGVMNLLSTSNDKKRKAEDLTAKFGVQIDTRIATEVLDDLWKSGIDAVPIMTPANHLFVGKPDGSVMSEIQVDGNEVIPLAGVSGKVTVLCNEGRQWVDYRSDEHGFNNPNKIWHSHRVDIAALGDSYTQGYCVPPEKNFVSIIGQLIFPFILTLLASALQRYPFADRLMLFSIPILIMPIAEGTERARSALTKSRARRLLYVGVIALLLFKLMSIACRHFYQLSSRRFLT